MKKLAVLAGAIVLVFGIVGHANAIPYTAYEVSPGAIGNQIWTGSLGMDFDVNQTIVVTALGVFDSGGDGLTGTLYVQLYDRTATSAPLDFLVFTGDNAGTLEGGSRFLNLPTPLTLSAGFQGSIVAFGFNEGSPNGNLGNPPFDGILTMDDGGGVISFVGGARYADQYVTSFPTNPDGGPENRYAAGTFKYNVPEPTTLLLLGIGLIGLAGLSRKKFLK